MAISLCIAGIGISTGSSANQGTNARTVSYSQVPRAESSHSRRHSEAYQESSPPQQSCEVQEAEVALISRAPSYSTAIGRLGRDLKSVSGQEDSNSQKVSTLNTARQDAIPTLKNRFSQSPKGK